MNARDARKIATSMELDKHAKQLKKINELIAIAVNDGKFLIVYYEKIFEPVANKLKEDGFSVTNHYDQHDGYTNTISW